jgi:hypothetical protein
LIADSNSVRREAVELMRVDCMMSDIAFVSHRLHYPKSITAENWEWQISR